MTRIALVEDDVAIREALSDLLVQRGYEPVEICDWAHASQAVLDAATWSFWTWGFRVWTARPSVESCGTSRAFQSLW